MFSVHTMRETFENSEITRAFGCVIEEISGKRKIMIIVTLEFSKKFVFKMFSVDTKTQTRVFRFLWFEKRFRKTPFS